MRAELVGYLPVVIVGASCSHAHTLTGC
jgi:hypothetical protein